MGIWDLEHLQIHVHGVIHTIRLMGVEDKFIEATEAVNITNLDLDTGHHEGNLEERVQVEGGRQTLPSNSWDMQGSPKQGLL